MSVRPEFLPIEAHTTSHLIRHKTLAHHKSSLRYPEKGEKKKKSNNDKRTNRLYQKKKIGIQSYHK